MAGVLDQLQVALETRYSIQHEIGHGGMAVVYLAQDLRHERTIALKVLQPRFSEALGADRFLREIKVAARLHHPHPVIRKRLGAPRAGHYSTRHSFLQLLRMP